MICTELHFKKCIYIFFVVAVIVTSGPFSVHSTKAIISLCQNTELSLATMSNGAQIQVINMFSKGVKP